MIDQAKLTKLLITDHPSAEVVQQQIPGTTQWVISIRWNGVVEEKDLVELDRRAEQLSPPAPKVPRPVRVKESAMWEEGV